MTTICPWGRDGCFGDRVAERLGVREIVTLDRRHFTTVRASHAEAFTLLPETLG